MLVPGLSLLLSHLGGVVDPVVHDVHCSLTPAGLN